MGHTEICFRRMGESLDPHSDCDEEWAIQIAIDAGEWDLWFDETTCFALIERTTEGERQIRLRGPKGKLYEVSRP